MSDVGGIAGDRRKSFIERIERLHEERKTLADDIAEVYAEAKGTGFDPKIMRMLIKERRMDKDALDEQETLLDIYRRALGMLPLEEYAERASGDLNDEVAAGLGASIAETAISNIKTRSTKAAKRFVDAVVPKDGESVSLTVNGKGVKITNKGGKKTVEPVGAEA